MPWSESWGVSQESLSALKTISKFAARQTAVRSAAGPHQVPFYTKCNDAPYWTLDGSERARYNLQYICTQKPENIASIGCDSLILKLPLSLIFQMTTFLQTQDSFLFSLLFPKQDIKNNLFTVTA